MTQPVLADGVAVNFGREAAGTPGTRPATGWRKLQVNGDGIDGLSGENIEVDRDQVLSPNLTDERGEVVGYHVKPMIKLDLTDDVLDLTRELAFRSATKHSGGTNTSEFFPTAVTNGAPSSWTVAAGGALPAGTLVKGFNFANAANNGLHLVAAGSDNTHVKTADALVTEAIAANTNPFLAVAGFQFLADDAAIDVNGNLTTVAQDCTLLGLYVGQQVWLGSAIGTADAYTPPLAGAGYAIVAKVSAHLVTLIHPQYVVGVDACAGKTLRLRYKSMNTNVVLDPTGADGYLVEPTCSLELSELGAGGGTDFTETSGCGIGKLTLEIPVESKVSAHIEMMGRTRTDPSAVRGAGCVDAIAPVRPGIYTTAAKLLGLRLMKQSDGSAINAEVNSATVTVDNGVKPLLALGKAGAAGLSFGSYKPGIQFKGVYVHDNDLTKLANANTDVIADFVMKSETGGFGMYFPMIKLRKPKKAYKKGDSVTIDVELKMNRDPATGILWSMSQFADLP